MLTSDIRGVREQAQAAGILVDPPSAEKLAGGIYRVWTDGGLRHVLSEKGRKRLARYNHEGLWQRVPEILEEAKSRVRVEEAVCTR